MAWVVVLLEEVDAWYRGLWDEDESTATLVAAAINLLEEDGPNLGRPLADRIEGSKLHNLKELRPGSTGTSEVRILFIFDPERQAVLLVAGDKSGQWSEWYGENIPVAESRYARWLAGGYSDEIGGWAMAKATNWQDVKADLRAEGKLDDEKVQAQMERLRSEVRMHRPAEIRESLGITQQLLAAQIGVSQSRVSQIERGELEHTEVATLRNYFRELGGEVEVVVRLGDERLQIA